MPQLLGSYVSLCHLPVEFSPGKEEGAVRGCVRLYCHILHATPQIARIWLHTVCSSPKGHLQLRLRAPGYTWYFLCPQPKSARPPQCTHTPPTISGPWRGLAEQKVWESRGLAALGLWISILITFPL